MLSQRLPLDQMQVNWANQLNPIIANPLVQGQLLTGVALINGATVINHGLGRTMQGWILADQDAAASVYRSAAFNTTTLTLTSNAAVTVSLWVF